MAKWNILNTYNPDLSIVDQLLENRNFQTTDSKFNFLNPPSVISCINEFPQEFKKSLVLARDLIKTAMSQNVPIIIYGDYDADGICATAILYKTLKQEFHYDCCAAFIPNRFEDGYGLSKTGMDKCLAILQTFDAPKGLIITVDTGITGAKEVLYAQSLGFDVIVTDHHQPPEVLPAAQCIVWSDLVVGSTISWFLSRALGSKDPQSLGLACLATITDVQPLIGINRSIVKFGLDILNSNPPIGISKLMELSGKSSKRISVYDLGWIIGPKLNASGRLEEAMTSFDLFVHTDESEIARIASLLDSINQDRQQKTLEMYDIASSTLGDVLPKIILSAHADYHDGIIGLVASRLVQKHYRPAIVISLGEDFGKGSVRSIPGIDIISILRQFTELFTNLGGHPMAAGFTIHKDNIPTLETQLHRTFNSFEDSLFVPSINIDLSIPLQKANNILLHDIQALEPFGLGNKEPLFLSTNVQIVNASLIGADGRHLSLKFFDGFNYYKGIYFDGGSRLAEIQNTSHINIVYEIKENEYNGNTYVNLVLKDFSVPA